MTTQAGVDAWDPNQYRRFAAERAQSFYDLLSLVSPVPGGRVIDLGCGTGELTAELHRHTGAAQTLGIDSSSAMLEQATRWAGDGVRFEPGDIGEFGTDADADAQGEGDGAGGYDVVFANASLQWLPDHPSLLAQLASTLRPGGQLAVQVPANADHASHLVAAQVASERPFVDAFGGEPPADTVRGVLAPEAYAELLDELGFGDQHVRLQVYGHRLASVDEVAEWTKGTALTRFRRRLTPEQFDAFVDRYRERLRVELGERSPYFYAFKRILFWARRPGG